MLTRGPLRLQFDYIGVFLEPRKWNNRGPFMLCLGFLSAKSKDNQAETSPSPSPSPTPAAWCLSFGKKSIQLRAIYIALVSLCFCASYKLFNVDLLYYMQKQLLTPSLPRPSYFFFFFPKHALVSTSNSSHPIPIAPPTPSTQFVPSGDLSPKDITIFIIWVALLFIALVCFLCHWVTHKMKRNRARHVVVNPLPPPPLENEIAKEAFGLWAQ